MKILIFKWLLGLTVFLSLPGYAQRTDEATLPVLRKDLAKQTARLAEISGLQAIEAVQQDRLAALTEAWVVMNDSVQEGLRRFGQDFEEGNDSTQTDHTAFELFWLTKGLWKQIRQMVDLYGEYLSGFEDMKFVNAALRNETTDVFVTQGYNTIEVFNNMMGIIRDQSSANPQMSVRQCYTKGEDMMRQVKSINATLKWQLRRVYEFALMNNKLDPFGTQTPPVKGDFDPADMNRQR